MNNNDNKVEDPKKGESSVTTAPSKPVDGKTDSQDTSVPDKFKGKTVEDIAHMYGELEKVYGKHSDEVHEYREKIKQWEALGNVIKGNPEILKAVESEIEKISGKKLENKDENKNKPVRDDTRIAVENGIINNFERQYGIDRLEQGKRAEIHKRIGQELGDMLDPTGKRTTADILENVSLEKLPRYLEKAYKLATLDDEKEKARSQAFLQANQNRDAIIGSMPSSGGSSEGGSLTPEQRKVAQKMHITEEKYLANLKAIEEGK